MINPLSLNKSKPQWLEAASMAVQRQSLMTGFQQIVAAASVGQGRYQGVKITQLKAWRSIGSGLPLVQRLGRASTKVKRGAKWLLHPERLATVSPHHSVEMTQHLPAGSVAVSPVATMAMEQDPDAVPVLHALLHRQ
ncbi:MAG: hypothetical protein K2Q97_07575 [Burkholderiaceae bacterium]|nr:hypothetical protein [Burkholderiaceae bacterium]